MDPNAPNTEPVPQPEAQSADIMRAMWEQLQELSQRYATLAAQQNNASPSAPRRSKPKAPDTFDGHPKADVITWLFGVELYFNAAHITADVEKLEYVYPLLRGNALLWLQRMQKKGKLDDINTWEQFTKAVKVAFMDPTIEHRARDDLARARQTSTISQFAAYMRSLELRIVDISEEELKDRFIRGITNRDIRRELFIRDPETFDEAVAIAERMEASLRRDSFTGPPRTNTNYNRHGNHRDFHAPRPMPMELGNINHRPAGRLPEEEKQRLRQANLCFYCKHPGHIAIHCPEKKRRALQGNAQPRH